MPSRWQHVLDDELCTESFWSDRDSHEAGPTATDPPKQVEIAILGDGFVGAAAALALAARGKDVCLVPTTPRSAVLDEAGLGLIAKSAGRHIAAQPPLFLAAASPMDFRHLAQQSDESMQTRSNLIGASDQWEVMGSAYYQGGLLINDGGALDVPVALAHLQGAAREEGAHYTDGFRAVAAHAGEWTLDLAGGECLASTLLVTAPVDSSNTAIASPFTVPSQYLVTEPVPLELVATICPRMIPIRELSRCGYEFRMDPSGRRFMFRAPEKSDRLGPREAALRLYPELLSRWPQLRGIRLTHSWAGTAWYSSRTGAAPSPDNVYHAWGSGCDAAALVDLGIKTGNALADGRAPQNMPVNIPVNIPAPAWLRPLTGAYRRWADRRARRELNDKED